MQSPEPVRAVSAGVRDGQLLRRDVVVHEVAQRMQARAGAPSRAGATAGQRARRGALALDALGNHDALRGELAIDAVREVDHHLV